jgi:hypothetical protein
VPAKADAGAKLRLAGHRPRFADPRRQACSISRIVADVARVMMALRVEFSGQDHPLWQASLGLTARR